MIAQISTCPGKSFQGLMGLANKSTGLIETLQPWVGDSWRALGSPHLSFGLLLDWGNVGTSHHVWGLGFTPVKNGRNHPERPLGFFSALTSLYSEKDVWFLSSVVTAYDFSWGMRNMYWDAYTCLYRITKDFRGCADECVTLTFYFSSSINWKNQLRSWQKKTKITTRKTWLAVPREWNGKRR